MSSHRLREWLLVSTIFFSSSGYHILRDNPFSVYSQEVTVLWTLPLLSPYNTNMVEEKNTGFPQQIARHCLNRASEVAEVIK